MQQVDVETLQEWLARGRPVTVLDIRAPEDRAQWFIAGSIHVNAYEALKSGEPEALQGVCLPNDRPVVTICNAGKVSEIAADRLRERGFEAFSLAGGMRAWSLAWNTAEIELERAAVQLPDLLCQGPRTVESLARETDLTLANASQHLRVLHSARLVETEKAGLFVTYRLADLSVCGFFQGMRSLGEKRLAEIDSILRQFREAPDSLEPVEKKTLVSRVRKGEVILLDVRPGEEYRAAHISGAVSVPLKELNARLSKLPRGKQIVAYSRGPYCILAIEAVRLLNAKGFRAARLEDGVPEWRARGLPVAAGEAPR